ncbi:hypothetical protein T4E_3332 [Trichinella pseudospiralis]|uniref:Uncharacterized protein n=1 Tax=Trichinella pseudospiralis TaxID=6337 RepID=A0A0V0XLP9_TRIPS|nr:hypothetical protein T4E_3332 [Trichinella pseudospiralis]
MTFLKCIVSYVAHIYNIRVKGKEALQAGGCTGCAISDFCSRLINRSGRVWICPDFRFQANAVENGVRTAQNLSKHVMPEATTIVTIFFRLQCFLKRCAGQSIHLFAEIRQFNSEIRRNAHISNIDSSL